MVKDLPANAGDEGSIPRSGRSLEEETATHSSILVWEIPWTEEPGGFCNHGVAKELVTKQQCLKSLQHAPSLPTPAADHSYLSFSTSKTR